jgi:O-succinylbenzoate synthase
VLDLSEVHVVSIPMLVPFRGVLHREALLLRGPAGWGEFAPFLEYEDAESARSRRRWWAGRRRSATGCR